MSAVSPLGPCLAISDRRSLPPDLDFATWLDAAADADVGAVQIREKDLGDRALYELARRSKDVVAGRPTRLLLNGRPDIALAAGLDGVHLTSTGIPVVAIRRRFGRRWILGVSTHRLQEIRAARDGGADYAVFGPIWETPSKAGLGHPQGLSALREAASLNLPTYALGGVRISSLAEVASHGGSGVAGIRIFQDLDRLGEVVARASDLWTAMERRA